MEHIKRVGRELMYKGSMLEFYKDTIVTPDGKTAYWDHIEHKGAAAVVQTWCRGLFLGNTSRRN